MVGYPGGQDEPNLSAPDWPHCSCKRNNCLVESFGHVKMYAVKKISLTQFYQRFHFPKIIKFLIASKHFFYFCTIPPKKMPSLLRDNMRNEKYGQSWTIDI